MEIRTHNRKELISEFKELLKGKTHEQVYHENYEKYSYLGKNYIEFLCSTPHPDKVKKYKWIWIGLVFFVLGMIAMKIKSIVFYAQINYLINIFYHIFGIVVYIILIPFILKCNKYVFQFIGVTAIMGLITLHFHFNFNGVDTGFSSLDNTIYFILLGYLIFSGLFIYFTFFARYKTEKIIERKMDGTGKVVLKVIFK